MSMQFISKTTHFTPVSSSDTLFTARSARLCLPTRKLNLKRRSDKKTDIYVSLFTLADLQLAAELGKTLLQRNKELERDLVVFQDHAEDQALEIDVSHSPSSC